MAIPIMQHGIVVRNLFRHIILGGPCQTNTTHQLQRRLHINCPGLIASRLRPTHQHNGLLDTETVQFTTPCKTLCTEYRSPQELYKTLYERKHPFYKIIKQKRKKFVARHPLPLVEVQTEAESTVLLYDDEETLRSMGKAYLAEEPVDDVYVMKHYPPEVVRFVEVIDRLRSQDKWDYNPSDDPNRDVMVTLTLDGKLENKKKVGAFEGFLAFPHKFTAENRVFCFAQDGDVQKAKAAGAYIVAGPERIDDFVAKRIQVTKKTGVYTGEETEVSLGTSAEGAVDFVGDVEYVDYVVSTPSVVRTLQPIKRLLKNKFPTAKKGMINRNIAEAIDLFKTGTLFEGKYIKDENEEEHFTCVMSIGKLDMTNEQLEENLEVLIADMCTRKPLKLGPFITEISVTASHLDTYTIQSAHYMPQPEVEDEHDTLQELEMLEKEMNKESI